MGNKIVTVTGPSCSGKTTLVRKLLNTGKYSEILSTTSRQPRQGEVDGKDYNFKSREFCLEQEKLGNLVEIVKFNDNYYCTEKVEVTKVFDSGKIPIIIVEPNGVHQLSRYFTCFSIYVDNTLESLYTRFLERVSKNLNANYDYESKRLISITKEYKEWPKAANYNFIIEKFDAETEAQVLESLERELGKG